MIRRGFFALVAVVLWLAVVGGCGFSFYYAYANGGLLGVIGAAAVVVALVIYPAYKSIPTMHYGMVTFLGIRTGKILREGPHFTLPLLERVRLFSGKVAVTNVTAKLYTLDGLIVLAKGILRWRIHPKLLAIAYVENYDVILEWLASKTAGELEAIAGQHKAMDLVRRKEAVVNLINCSLRMAVPPHVEKQIAPEHLLEFYRGSDLRNLVLNEERLAEQRSTTETECGIEILSFVMVFDFSPTTDRALELEGQTKLTLAAHKLTAEQELALVRDLKAEGLDPQQAVEAEEVVLQRSKRKIFSLGGLEKFKPFGK
jgi:hypothetical protein